MKQFSAFTFIMLLCLTGAFAQQKKETLRIHWPEEYKWIVVKDEDKKTMHTIEYVPEGEKMDKWTLLATQIKLKNIKKVKMKDAMKWMLNQVKEDGPKAKLTLIEKDDDAKHPWVLFKIEVPEFKNDEWPECQFYYIVQGRQALYTNFVSTKDKTLSEEFIAKWSKVFKASILAFE